MEHHGTPPLPSTTAATAPSAAERRLVVFDFDGTYLTCDSLAHVLRHLACGWRLWWGILVCLPWIVLYKLHLMSGGRAKERLVGHFVAGMPAEEFATRCEAFARSHRGLVRPEAQQAMSDALAAGHQVMVVTASIRQWVEPWFEALDVTIVATELEEDAAGRLTGRFATPNCLGAEKWRRLCDTVPDAPQRYLVAYGDSGGDKELLDRAHEPYYRSFDTTRDRLPATQRHPGRLFATVMVLLALYELLGVFFGLDLADAGFYLTFYDNIFTHPESVEYNFMYYLSGVIGGTAQWLLPSMGLAGMRLLGMALNLSCGVVLYMALHHHVDERALALGAALVVVAFIAPPLTLCYDLCTIACYVCAVVALWHGMRRRSTMLMAVAGALAGLNVLMRIPNVLGLVMAVVPLLAAACRREHRWGEALKHSAIVLVAAGIAVAVVVAVMPATHRVLLRQVLSDLRAIAADTSGTASHSTGQMVITQLQFYAMALWAGVKLALPVVLLAANRNTLSTHVPRLWARIAPMADHLPHTAATAILLLVRLAALALMVWLVARMHPLQPLWAMCLAGCIAVMVRHRSEPLAFMALLGLGVMLVMPVGSDGAYNNGTIVCWVAAPLAALWWRHRPLMPLPATLLVVCAVRMVTGGAYFDGGTLLAKHDTIDNARAAHVLTTRERAEALNTTLHGIAQHVPPGSTLMVYGSSPLLNYLTHTHPYIGCSWVEQLSATMLHDRLTAAAQQELPPVLRQKFSTLGSEWGTPSDRFLTDYGTQNTYQDNRKLTVLNAWLTEHHYRTAYEDSHYVLLTAADQAP